MSRFIHLLLLVPLCGCASVTGKSAANLSDAEFAAAFICPENQTQLERDQAIHAYTEFVDARHSNWTVEQRLSYRMNLLKAKNCTRSLAELQASGS